MACRERKPQRGALREPHGLELLERVDPRGLDDQRLELAEGLRGQHPGASLEVGGQGVRRLLTGTSRKASSECVHHPPLSTAAIPSRDRKGALSRQAQKGAPGALLLGLVPVVGGFLGPGEDLT